MNESVVECRFNVAHAEDVLLVLLVGVHLRRSVISNLLFLLLRLFTLSFGLNTHKHPINHLSKPESATIKINPDSPRDRPQLDTKRGRTTTDWIEIAVELVNIVRCDHLLLLIAPTIFC